MTMFFDIVLLLARASRFTSLVASTSDKAT